MKLFGSALVLSTGAIAVGLGVAVEAAALSLGYVQAGLGTGTPIDGITLGVLLLGGSVGAAAAWRAGLYLIRFGGDLEKWRSALHDATGQQKKTADVIDGIQQNVRSNSDNLDKLLRWQTEIDPILAGWRTRNGPAPGQKRA